MRRTGMRLLVCGAAVVAMCGVQLGRLNAQSQPKPNVLLITLDDMAISDFKTLLDRNQLPAIKFLIDSGYQFTESFASGSVGSTSRISILSGQYAQNHGEKGADLFFGGPVRHNEATLLPNWLRGAGYVSAKIGRTVPGYGAGDLSAAEFSAIRQGIPGGLPAGFYSNFPPSTHIPAGWDIWQVFIEPYTWSVDKFKISLNGRKVDFAPVNTPVQQIHQTDLVAALTGSLIRTLAPYPTPWFIEAAPVTFNRELWPGPSIYNVCPDTTDPLAWWFGGPYSGTSQRPPLRRMNSIWDANSTSGVANAAASHPLPKPASFNEADVSDKPRWVQMIPPINARDEDCLQKRYWRRLETLRSVDDLVAYALTALIETNELPNTYVILTTDNGLSDGQHRYNEKLSPYDESIRTMLVIRPPGGTTARKIDRLVLGIDIAPTIAAIAGATPNITVDGRNLLPLMQNPAMPWRRIGLLQHTLGLWDPGDGSTSPREYWGLRSSSDSPSLFVQYPTVQTGVTGELYDLTSDPSQLSNLYADPARQDEVAAIATWLAAMKTCKGADCRWYEDNFSRVSPLLLPAFAK